MLAHLGRATARHRSLILAVWAVLTLVGAVLGGGVFDRTTTVDSLHPDAPSAQAQARLDELDPEGPVLTAVVGGVDFFTPSLVESATGVMYEIREMPGSWRSRTRSRPVGWSPTTGSGRSSWSSSSRA
ncbi:hypothetical protein NKG05_04230 [Oerskovia sp. M15]